MMANTWILLFTTIAAVAASISAAATIASMRSRPRLKAEYELESTPADAEGLDGTLHVRVCNLGRVTARNVVGWLRFDLHSLTPMLGEAVATGVVTIAATTLRPCLAKQKDQTNLSCTIHIDVPVRIHQLEATQVEYYFASDEGAEIKGEFAVEV